MHIGVIENNTENIYTVSLEGEDKGNLYILPDAC